MALTPVANSTRFASLRYTVLQYCPLDAYLLRFGLSSIATNMIMEAHSFSSEVLKTKWVLRTTDGGLR